MIFTTTWIFPISNPSRSSLPDYFHTYPVKTALIYFLIYLVVTGLSLPGAAVLSLLAGAIFGLPVGATVVLLAATCGATIAFWLSRYILRDFVQNRFGDKLRAVNRGIEKDGGILSVHTAPDPHLPVFRHQSRDGPHAHANVCLFCNEPARHGGRVHHLCERGHPAGQSGVFGRDPDAGPSFRVAAAGNFPVGSKKSRGDPPRQASLCQFQQAEKGLIATWSLSVQAREGLVAALIAATVKARVTLIEKNKMGGDCLNTGCVPSKALIRSAKFVAQSKRAEQYGCEPVQVTFDFKKIMQRVRRVIKTVEPHDSVERYTQLGVECIQGEAELKDPWTVAVNGKTLTSRNIVLATGASPLVPDIPGLAEAGYYTSDTIWDIEELPERMVVLGGGPIGCELAQCFARLGSQVTQVQRRPRILPREDPDIAAMVAESFSRDGVRILTEHAAKEILQEQDSKVLICSHKGEEVSIPFDTILVAVGTQGDLAPNLG